MSSDITIRDVALRAGVSVATASRVLNDHKATSPESRSAVRKAAEELSYSPNGLASSLRSARTQSVGVLVSDIRNPFFSELYYVIQTALFERGYCTMLGNSSERDDLQDQYLKALQRQRIAGLICAPQGDGTTLLGRLAREGLPMVFVDRTLPVEGVPCVDSDPAPGIEAALDRFARDGHRRVGFVAGPQNSSTGVERLAVFRRLAASRFETSLVGEGGYDQDVCARSVAQLVEEGATALLFGYSPNAITALRVLTERGLRVPDDLSLVSFDEIPFFEMVSPAVSVIAQGITTMGRQAVDMLTGVMGGEAPATRRLPTSFVLRSTNGPGAPTKRSR